MMMVRQHIGTLRCESMTRYRELDHPFLFLPSLPSLVLSNMEWVECVDAAAQLQGVRPRVCTCRHTENYGFVEKLSPSHRGVRVFGVDVV